MVIERKQFPFSEIECHKPSVTPQYYAGLTQVHQSLPPSHKPRLTKTGIEWFHLHRSLFLIEPHQEDH